MRKVTFTYETSKNVKNYKIVDDEQRLTAILYVTTFDDDTALVYGYPFRNATGNVKIDLKGKSIEEVLSLSTIEILAQHVQKLNIFYSYPLLMNYTHKTSCAQMNLVLFEYPDGYIAIIMGMMFVSNEYAPHVSDSLQDVFTIMNNATKIDDEEVLYFIDQNQSVERAFDLYL